MSVRIETSQNVAVEYEIASLGDRILATLIDRFIYVAWAMLCFLLFQSVFKNNNDASLYVVMFLLILPILFYSLLTEYFMNGQTLGKRALNIKVVRLDGSQPTFGNYLMRWLLCIVDFQLLSSLVAVVAIAANGKGQRIGDIAAGTAVIKTKKRITLQQIVYQNSLENHIVTYQQVAQLTDADIETIRQVLRKQNDMLIQTTAEKISKILGVVYVESDQQFLQTVVDDYVFIAHQEAES